MKKLKTFESFMDIEKIVHELLHDFQSRLRKKRNLF